MVTIVKHEWHQHDRQYAIELDESLLSEIYPDLDEDEIAQKLADIESGEVDYEEVLDDAYNNDVEIEWDFQYDDCWTDRKGGYDITYELGDEDSWVTPPKDPEPTHKCTKCKWVGQSYQTDSEYLREDGTVIEDYFSSEEESHSTKDTCPMCDSDTELTEVGLKEKQEREARWAKEEEEADEAVPCYSCNEPHRESDLVEMSSQYICPSCGEGWVMMDQREEELVDEAELLEALEELKREFEELMVHTIQCTECGWSGIEKDCYKEGICPECAAHTELIERDEN
jgi:predicted Zn-ribbon and HTH transcriptional regulator